MIVAVITAITRMFRRATDPIFGWERKRRELESERLRLANEAYERQQEEELKTARREALQRSQEEWNRKLWEIDEDWRHSYVEPAPERPLRNMAGAGVLTDEEWAVVFKRWRDDSRHAKCPSCRTWTPQERVQDVWRCYRCGTVAEVIGQPSGDPERGSDRRSSRGG